MSSSPHPFTPEQFPFGGLPELGATPDATSAGQTIKLGGFSGLWFEGTTDDGKLRFLMVPDRGSNGEPTDTNDDGTTERPFALPDYQARIVPFTLDPASGEISINEDAITFLTRADGITLISGRPNIAALDDVPVDLEGLEWIKHGQALTLSLRAGFTSRRGWNRNGKRVRDAD